METFNKFPAGPFIRPEKYDRNSIEPFILEIEQFPSKLAKLVGKLTPEQLNTKTLPGIWSVAQVVNHIADSHMNAFIRTKLTLTEDNPTISPYEEDLWANLPDGLDTNIENSLNILYGVHSRLVIIFSSLNDEALKRTYYHPGYDMTYILGQVVALYAWHGNHHYGYISDLMENKKW